MNTPDDGSTESPGCSAMADLNVHVVFVSARAAGKGTHGNPTVTTVTAEGLSPLPIPAP